MFLSPVLARSDESVLLLFQQLGKFVMWEEVDKCSLLVRKTFLSLQWKCFCFHHWRDFFNLQERCSLSGSFFATTNMFSLLVGISYHTVLLLPALFSFNFLPLGDCFVNIPNLYRECCNYFANYVLHYSFKNHVDFCSSQGSNLLKTLDCWMISVLFL